MKKRNDRPEKIDLKAWYQTVKRKGVSTGRIKKIECKANLDGTVVQTTTYSSPRPVLLLSCGHEREIGKNDKLYRVGDRCACTECRHAQRSLDDRFRPPAVFFRPRAELPQWMALFPTATLDENRTIPYSGAQPAVKGALLAEDSRDRGRVVVWFIVEA